MRFVKLAIISFIFFVMLITGISLFIPSHIVLTKAVSISAPQDSVFAMISDPQQWKKWYPGLDSAQLLYEGSDIKGVQMLSSDRSLRITSETPNHITALLTRNSMRPINVQWTLSKDHQGNVVMLTWYMEFSLRWYPWEKFSSLVLEKTYGATMDQGLSHIKYLLEKQ